MSTKNHKPATTSDIISNPQIQQSGPPSTLDTRPSSPSPSTLHTRHSANPFSAATRSRCGKVARLPKEIRDQLNEMLLDGLPHSQIIQKLHDQFGPQSNLVPLDPQSPSSPHESRITHHDSSNSDHASRITNHGLPNAENPSASGSIENQNGRTSLVSKIENLDALTPHHITTWKKFGGYRDWLQDQQRLHECKLRHELTLDLARSAEGLASYQAAPKVAVAQICQTIIDLGPEGLKEAMQASPLNCFRLLNALARLINSGLKCETQIRKSATTAADGQKPEIIDRAEIQRIEKDLNLL